MRQDTVFVIVCLTAAAALLAPAGAAWAAEDPAWTDVAEFSAVVTGGNTESTSVGFKNLLQHKWERNTFTFRVGGIRVESEVEPRRALCLDPANCSASGPFRVRDAKTDTTAEAYYAKARYERTVTERFFWYGGLNWDRNRFAGVENRYVGEAGVGNVWYDREDLKFSTSYGVTFTDQEDVLEIPGIDDTFAGYRFAWDYLNQLTTSTSYTNQLTLDGNIDEGSDWRGDMDNGLSVSINSRLAIKLGLRLLYDNEPAFEALKLFDPATGQQVTASGAGVTVQHQLDELDTIFTAGVVVNFK